MGLLEDFLGIPTLPAPLRRRSKSSEYLPFTERRYLGRYAMPPSRDIDFISNALLFSGSRAALNKSYALRMEASYSPLNEIEDRRKWRPESDITLDTSGRQVTPTDVSNRIATPEFPYTPDEIRHVKMPKRNYPFKGHDYLTNVKNAPWWYGFKNPRKTVICIKRKIRREVLSAFGVTGRTGLGPSIRNAYSHVKC